MSDLDLQIPRVDPSCHPSMTPVREKFNELRKHHIFSNSPKEHNKYSESKLYLKFILEILLTPISLGWEYGTKSAPHSYYHMAAGH